MPMRRLQPRHPAAFLVDQDRRRVIAHGFAQSARPGRAPDRVFRCCVPNRMKPQGRASRKKCALRPPTASRAGAAINRAACASLLAQEAGAAVRLQPVAQGRGDILAGEAARSRRRYQVPFSPRSACCTSARIARQQRGMLGLVDLPGGIGVGLGFVGADLQHHRPTGGRCGGYRHGWRGRGLGCCWRGTAAALLSERGGAVAGPIGCAGCAGAAATLAGAGAGLRRRRCRCHFRGTGTVFAGASAAITGFGGSACAAAAGAGLAGAAAGGAAGVEALGAVAWLASSSAARAVHRS